MTRRSAVIWTLLMGGVLAFPSTSAQSQTDRPSISVSWREGRPSLSVDLTGLANEQVRRDLSSGLRKKFVVIAQAYRVGRSEPIATQSFACSITYDLWEQSYIVRTGERSRSYANVGQVLDRCLDLNGFAVGHASDYAGTRGQDIFFAIRAEFDPIDPRRCRQLLRSSGGIGDPIGPLVINIVRRDICQANRAVEYRSAPIVCR